ncbi:MAG: hypothetical protein KAS23_09830 [Anaerohalosphaera sp.]|nr:hypothetical protein [Anaerohalosphaera sp.]
MKTKTARLAIAAVLLIAVLSLTIMDKTVSPAYALEQSLEAMKNETWMHMVPYSQMKGAETVFGENWFSATHGIEAIKRGDGSCGISYFDKDESYSYDPATETITLSLVNKANIISRTNSYGDLFNNIIDTLNEHAGTEITKTAEVQNGKNVIAIEVKVPKGDPLGSIGTEHWLFTMDEDSYLPTRMKLQGYDEDGEFVEVFDAAFDYPNNGPMDIYELGVPKTAKIIDKRPTMEVQTIITNYHVARENDPQRYTALVLYTRSNADGSEVADEATIYYVDGNKFRREQLSIKSDTVTSQRKARLGLETKMGDSLESILEWWTNREHLSHRNAEMYDGEYKYQVHRNLNVTGGFKSRKEKNTKTRNRNSKPPNLHNMYTAGAQFMQFISNDVTKEQKITLIENDYSRQNGLICLQRIEADRRYPFMRNGRRYKRLCYIDPGKDYICRRIEEYFIQDELWKKMYNDADNCMIKNPDPTLEYTMLQIRESTRLSQTEDDRWYPKKIETRTTTQRDNGILQNSTATWTIYLDTQRQLPEDIFDSDAFSKYLE